MKIGLKLGSSSVSNGNGEINQKIIESVSRQLVTLIKGGDAIFLVSSGAVASDPKKHRSKNLRSAIGQIRLMNHWTKEFNKFDIETSQHLLTDRDLIGENRTITKRTILEAFDEKVVPIINGNDPVDDKELRALEICADNDILFKSICLLIGADVALIGFSEAGLIGLDGKVIHLVRMDNFENILSCANGGSKLGFGKDGMATKIEVLCELAGYGITSVLAPSYEKDFIFRALDGEKNFGTRFLP